MGNTIWVEIHGRPVTETAEDSSMMYRLMENLDMLAGKLAIRKLSDFYDYSELEQAYGDLGDDEGEDSDDEQPNRSRRWRNDNRKATGSTPPWGSIRFENFGND